MDMEREKLKLSQDMVMVEMEDLMEVMVVTEVMAVMDMERERLKLMLNQDIAMVVMVMEREMLSQDMVMEVMDMEDHMEAMVVTEGMVVMVMESNLFLNGTLLIKLYLTEQKLINSI